MAIAGGSKRVYSITPVFRAEDLYTQFTSLDVEKEIDSHYSEVMDIVDRLFVAIFDRLNEKCKPSIEAVAGQYPFKPLKVIKIFQFLAVLKTLRLKFDEGIQMLKDAGVEVDPLEDLNTEAERKLGELVLQKYGTEFYILYRCPLNIRPFYTMPCQDDPKYSNSFDVFIRGEQAISGAQHIHDAGLLKQRARECGIDVRKISNYMNSFRCGMRPLGGFEMVPEHAVKLFLGLNDIQKDYDVIQIKIFVDFPGHPYPYPEVDMVKTERTSIKVVEIVGFSGYTKEVNFVNYVMDYFVGLERIVIDRGLTTPIFDVDSIYDGKFYNKCNEVQARVAKEMALDLKSKASPTIEFIVI